jgi:hypothetical protein
VEMWRAAIVVVVVVVVVVGGGGGGRENGIRCAKDGLMSKREEGRLEGCTRRAEEACSQGAVAVYAVENI